MDDLEQDLHRMNMGQQRRQDPLFGDANEHPAEARFAPGPGARSPPVYHAGRQQTAIHPMLEQYSLTKGVRNTFTVAIRTKDPVDEVDLRAKLDKLRSKGITGEQQLNLKFMEGSKRNQVLELIDDRNHMDPDPRFEWLIGCIDMTREPRNNDAWKLIRVVLQRKPATMPRVVRHPQQPFHMRNEVRVSSKSRGIGGRQNSTGGREKVYHDQTREDYNARAIHETRLRQQQLEQQLREALHQQQLRDHEFREQQAAAMRQAAGAGAAKADAKRPSFDHGHAGGNAGGKKNAKGQKSKGGKQTPIIHVSDSDSGSDSGSDSDSASLSSGGFDRDSDLSNDDTNDTVYSDSTRHSREKAKKSPKGSPRRNRSASPQSRGGSSHRGDRRGSTYVQEHKRPVRDNLPPRKPRRASIYSNSDFVEIKPGQSSKRNRQDSLHSGSSYNSWHPSNGPTFGGPRYQRNHSFGLNTGTGNSGFEQKERIAGYQRHNSENDRDREHEEFLKKKEREAHEESIRIKLRKNDLEKEELREREMERERVQKEREWERRFSRRDSPPRGRWGF